MIVFTEEGRRFLDMRLDWLSRLLISEDGATPFECGEGVAVVVDKRASVDSLIVAHSALFQAFNGLQVGKRMSISGDPSFTTCGKRSAWRLVVHLDSRKVDRAAREWIKAA